MHRSIILPVFLSLILAWIPATPAAAEGEAPWDGPPFSSTAEQMLQAAAAVPVDDDQGVQVLFEGARYLLDEEGRIDYRYRIVYRVDSPESVRGWSRTSRTWRPWFQDRPEIRARVITPDGAVHELDPANLGEYSEAEDGPDVYGNEQTLKGPLPAVEVGAIIEEEHVVRDREPMFVAGTVRTFVFGRKQPVLQQRLVVDAPSSLPLQYKLHRLPDLEPVRETDGDRLRLRFEGGPFEAWDEDVSLAPGDVARRPVVRFSTGASWNSVASAYSSIVDERIGTGVPGKTLRKAIGHEKEPGPVADKALAYLREQVRYTGVEFGERSIVPSTPEETLTRRFGDCKDKATLLVALLRAAGIDASVALLNTGPGSDVDSELPGIGRFDHAIVHVPGPPEIWIDPTSRFSRAGELPSGDQGRLVLIASEETTGLVLTPKTGPTDNERRETREVIFAAEGGGRVIETATVTGWFEREYRDSFSKKNESGLREQLESYVKSHYLAEELGEVTITDPEDLSRPMELRLEAMGCKRVWTTATEATAYLTIGGLVRDLPQVLKPDEAEDEEEEKPRQHPVLLPKPFVVEYVYEIEPPPGYALPTVPEGGRREFGPAVMTQEYTIGDDGAVTALLRFDTVKTLYSTEETKAIQEALAVFFKESNPSVVFHQVGEAHLEAGRIREALQEFRGLVARFPEEALYRTQVARAYLAAGLGGPARAEARRAVELAPESMIAWRTLGFILAHDELGRKFVRGFDPAAAEQAFRKAVEIDPEDFIARGELAILLEHGPGGIRYGEQARLADAITEYESLRETLENEGLTTNLMVVMLHAGRFAELRELWKDVPRDAMRDGAYLAAVAAIEGASQALAEASRIAGQADRYRQIVTQAGDLLVRVRRYPEAAELVAAGARGAADSVAQLTRADLLRRISLHETHDISLATPDGAVKTVFAVVADLEGYDVAAFRALFHPTLLEETDDDWLSTELAGLGEGLAWTLLRSGVTGPQALDFVLSTIDLSVDGNPDTGYRVRTRMPDNPVAGQESMAFYVVRYEDEYRVVGVTYGWSMIGRMLLDWVAEERLGPARTWLDWVVEDMAARMSEDVLDSAPLQWIWEAGQEGDAQRIRLAAASLMLDGAYGDLPATILREGTEAFPDGDMRAGLDLALAVLGAVTEDHEASLEAANRLAMAYPRSSRAFVMQAGALIELRRLDEAERLIQARVERFPGESVAATYLADIPRLRSDLAEYRRRLQARVASGQATAGEYNNLAWLDIVDDRVSDDTQRNVQRAVTMTNYSEVASLHTLASVYAELGHVAEARDVLLALLENRATSDLESPDWYVLGRIAEQYGVPDAAVGAFEKVEPPDGTVHEPEAMSTFALASRRLKAIRESEKAERAE